MAKKEKIEEDDTTYGIKNIGSTKCAFQFLEAEVSIPSGETLLFSNIAERDACLEIAQRMSNQIISV
jgi:hypothetical protein